MKQYAFTPPQTDPRIAAEYTWDTMLDELNTTREQLEYANANEVAQAKLIDMLQAELAKTKAAHEVDRTALTVVRTKLKVAGSIILDALREDAPEPQKQTVEPAELPVEETPQPEQEAIQEAPKAMGRDIIKGTAAGTNLPDGLATMGGAEHIEQYGDESLGDLETVMAENRFYYIKPAHGGYSAPRISLRNENPLRPTSPIRPVIALHPNEDDDPPPLDGRPRELTNNQP